MNEEVRVLPSDVWVEILRRIPAADLVPLKAVCKTFHRLISDDFFTRLHLNHFTKLHPNAKRAFIVPKVPTEPSHSYYYNPDKRTISVWHDEPRFDYWCNDVVPEHNHRVIDSYHGLLLVHIRDRILLYNPITRSYKFLPSFYDFPELDSLKIAYDDVSKQYKLFSLRILARTKVWLYVSDVRRDEELRATRRKIAWDFQNMEIIYKGNVLVNGSVYWLFFTRDLETLDGEITRGRIALCIVSVNVTTEEVKITRTCSINNKCYRYDLYECFAANGTFYQLQNYVDGHYYLRLWALEGFESENPNPSWTMKQIIDMDHLASTLSINLTFHHVLGVFCNKVLIIMAISRCPNRFFQYDLSSKEIEEVTVATGDNSIECDTYYSRNVEQMKLVFISI